MWTFVVLNQEIEHQFCLGGQHDSQLVRANLDFGHKIVNIYADYYGYETFFRILNWDSRHGSQYFGRKFKN